MLFFSLQFSIEEFLDPLIATFESMSSDFVPFEPHKRSFDPMAIIFFGRRDLASNAITQETNVVLKVAIPVPIVERAVDVPQVIAVSIPILLCLYVVLLD